MTARIVIVDDEIHIRTLIAQSLEELEDEGIEIATADNGADGLALCWARAGPGATGNKAPPCGQVGSSSTSPTAVAPA